MAARFFSAPLLFALSLLPAATASAQDAPSSPSGSTDDAPFAIHGQATFVGQATPAFRSPYTGPNSLIPDRARETVDATLFAGVRPWHGGEIWIGPEVDQGFGLSNTLGVAGFPSAEAYKVGRKSPYLRLQRLFFRQTFELGGGPQPVAAAAMAFGGTTSADRIVITVGKFGVGDVFDTNRYAHDPRGDFLNWALVDTGSFDYAADAWGYSTGAAGEWYQGSWTVRAGLFNLSTVPNGEVLERGFRQYQLDGEIEHRHRIGDRDGAVRITVFRNEGRFGRFADALALAATTGGAPDTAFVRERRSRWGAGLNAEQAVSDHAGLFVRAGAADGSVEPYDFTDIDRTAAAGASIDGGGWGRPGDTAGIGAIANGIATAHRRYLAEGGIGVLVGDGRLPHYGAEVIGEAWYKLAVGHVVEVTADYQLVGNPGYNRDRGPANVFALRLHGAL